MQRSATLWAAGHLAAMVLAAAALPAAAAEQRVCRFERQISETGTVAVNWRVTLATEGRRGTVVVDGSGRHAAKVRRGASGSVELRFATGVSDETITIGHGGEALWQIAFKDGRSMGYAGLCGPIRGD